MDSVTTIIVAVASTLGLVLPAYFALRGRLARQVGNAATQLDKHSDLIVKLAVEIDQLKGVLSECQTHHREDGEKIKALQSEVEALKGSNLSFVESALARSNQALIDAITALLPRER